MTVLIRRWLLLLLAVFMAAGCSTRPSQENRSGGDCGLTLDGDGAMHLQLVEELSGQGRDRAVLAHLDSLEAARGGLPDEAWLLRADAHRRLGEAADAEQIYRKLAEQCGSGHGFRGLGLLAAEDQSLGEAVEYFERARKRRPVDYAIHNDLGYAYLLLGQFDSARRHLETAYELGDESRAPSNLILLELIEEQYSRARAIAREVGVGSAQWRQLAGEAERLGTESGAGGWQTQDNGMVIESEQETPHEVQK